MKYGSLFSGIGGFDLGLDRAGMECAWQVEIDPFCRKVLEKHWPDVPKYEDVREVGAGVLEYVDLIAGGFPCQDVSYSGKRAGIEGERSGLWAEMARVVSEIRPRFVLVENVPGLLTDGLGRVLGDLAAVGFDAEWDCIPAAAVGAPHVRDRVFVVAYTEGESVQEQILETPGRLQGKPGGVGWAPSEGHHWQADQPPMVGMAYGAAGWVDVSRALGNAVVPQVAEWIGRRITETVST